MVNQHVKLFPPLRGAFIALDKVPDPVFAEKMVGDGFAIDPFDNILYAPLDGIIKSIHRSCHAITLTADAGFDILIHIGLETVALGGAGFSVKVKEGERVKTGQILTEFDIDFISAKAVALITPVLVTDLEEKKLQIEILPHGKLTDLSQAIMLVKLADAATSSAIAVELASEISESASITIPNIHGIHARPAALLNRIARNYPAEILLYKGERSASVKSVVGLLGLSIAYQDQVKIVVKGATAANGAQIIQEISTAILAMHDDQGEDGVASVGASEERSKIAGNNYFGLSASSGVAVAKLVQQERLTFKYQRYAADSAAELLHLEQSLTRLLHEMNGEIAGLGKKDLAHQNILTAHTMILTDPEITQNAKNMVVRGFSAAYAWDKSTEDGCKVLQATANQLLIERQSDLRDVRDRLLNLLCGKENRLSQEYAEEVILVAEDFTPSQIIALPPQVKGLVSVRGGVTSHVSILARTRAIPLLVGINEKVLHETASLVVLNADGGFLNLRPSAAEIVEARAQVNAKAEGLALAMQSASLPAVTADGVTINCLANIGNLSEAEIGQANGAKGVGLFRTEFMFLESSMAPSEDEQFKEYAAINSHLAGEPLVIRTLDAGGDKDIPYLSQSHEENPMLGVRGIRLCLAHRELLTTQLRAIIRTKASNIKIMLPMISKLSEYRTVKQIFAELNAELGVTNKMELGIMVEVPAVALMSEAFAREVDFMSIGTNDLTQYVMAVDREHTELGKEVDHLHPAVLSAIALTARGANKHATSLSVCGLMASERIAIPVLIGLGVSNLSMTVSAIPENKAFIRTLNYSHCQRVAEHCLGLASAQEVREYLHTQYN